MSDEPMIAASAVRRQLAAIGEDMTRMHRQIERLEWMREALSRAECRRQGLDPDDIIADGGHLAWFISRVVLDHLRKAARPMTAKEIAGRIIAERGLNVGDRALARNMNKRVGMAIRYQRTNGMVQEVGSSGAEVLWEISS